MSFLSERKGIKRGKFEQGEEVEATSRENKERTGGRREIKKRMRQKKKQA